MRNLIQFRDVHSHVKKGKKKGGEVKDWIKQGHP